MFSLNLKDKQQVSVDVLIEKYSHNDETEDDIYRRVAKQVAGAEKTDALKAKYKQEYYEMMKDGAIGAGRIMASAGTAIEATLANCFVQPIGDSIIDYDKESGYPGIYTALSMAAETMRRGGGVGYDFSRIRPRNALVKKTQSFASGPCSYIDVFDASCKTVEAAGCFAGDTLIHTTAGLIPIEDIVNSDKEFYAVTHKGPKKITAKFNSGVKEVWDAHTSYGNRVPVTLEHKFGQFKEGCIDVTPLKDIAIEGGNNDILIAIPETIFDSFIDPDYNKWTLEQQEAYLVGAFHGNGTWAWNETSTKVRGVSFNNNTTKAFISNKIFNILTNLGLKAKEHKVKDENTLRVESFSVIFFNAWKDEKGVDKHPFMKVPKFILETTPDVWAAYIAGMFEADGTISESKSNIRLRITNKELLEQIQILLNCLGIPNMISLERPENGTWKDIWLMGIYGPVAQRRFNKTVGLFMNKTLINISSRDRKGFGHKWKYVKQFGISSKVLKDYWSGSENNHPKVSLNALINTVNIPELSNTVSDTLVKIVRRGEIKTYDLEVEDVHMLSGNGVYLSNSRRGAQLAALRIDHPDVLEYITAKREEKRWNNFNVSVFVSDAFMEAKEKNLPWELVHEAEPTKQLIDKGAYQREDGHWVYSKVNANELWDTIMLSNYNFAEPGILFGDSINRDNNLRYVEVIEATNPCGEQSLPPYGCCDLGQIFLTKYISNPFTSKVSFDFNKLIKNTTSLVRFLDNVLDVTYWPLNEQKTEANNKRRIGVGFTGLGNALAMMNLHYDSKEAIEFTNNLGRLIKETCYKASVVLAKEKGSFPLLDVDKYLEEGTSASRLPEEIKKLIKKYGIRNSHLNSLAPVGTLSLAFGDNCSNGLEPPFSLIYTRIKREQDGSKKEYMVIDYGLKVYLSTIAEDKAKALIKAIAKNEKTFIYKDEILEVKAHLPASIVTALELSTDAHLAILGALVSHVDASMSKTINVPVDYSFDDFKFIYDKAFKLGLKGVATYRPNNILGSVLKVNENKPESVKEKTETIQEFMNTLIEKRPNDKLGSVTLPVSYVAQSGRDKFYISMSFIEKILIINNKETLVKRPIEVFVTAYPDDVPTEWIASHSRNLSLLARAGLTIFAKALRDSLKVKSDTGKIRYGSFTKADGTKVPRYHESIVACIAYAIQEVLKEEGIISEVGNPNYKDIKVYKEKADNKEEFINTPVIMSGKKCSECGAHAVIKKDGCDFCTNCGNIGSCG